jgi:DNA-binding transcriptional ArsR family regulator
MSLRREARVADSDREGFEREADVIRVLANPKRLMIVDVLGRSPATVTEIAERLDLSLQNTSQHLRVMKDRGIVRARRDGREVRYAIANPVLAESCHLVRRALLTGAWVRPARLPTPGGVLSDVEALPTLGPGRTRTAAHGTNEGGRK